MGTRNLTIVIRDKEPKIAQYGQWDGYPSGQGKTVLEFLQTTDLKVFKSKLDELEFFGDSKVDEKILKDIGEDENWNKKYPWLSRDMGGEILQCVYDGNITTKLQNQYDFAGDGLFCEWVYVVDLDKNTFEVYEGYNKKTPLNKTDRFYSLVENMKEKGEYYPVKLVKKYLLNKLPTTIEFLSYFNLLSEKENEDYIRESHKSGATTVLRWINEFDETNKGFPKANEIVAQLEMAIDEEINERIEAEK